MTQAPARVVVLTKDPIPGRVKTRTIPALGAAGAAALHRALVLHTLSVARTSGLPVVVSLAGELDGPFAAALRAEGAAVVAQGDGDLGDRLRHALRGPERQVCVGTDCPTMTAGDLRAAADAVGTVALGPAEDGGYWLVGIDGAPRGTEPPGHAIFRDVPWSSPRTLSVTLARARQAGLSVTTLPVRYDLDDPADLRRAAIDPACPAALGPFLS